jgi:DNA polymerase I-like protein with 3'-5' exonuclease and polymerase domains
MIDIQPVFFLYIKDFTDNGNDRYFLFEHNFFSEVTAADLVKIESVLVTHDYWLIAPSIFSAEKNLPKQVIDIVELSLAQVGKRATRQGKADNEISVLVRSHFFDTEDLASYNSIFYRREQFSSQIYILFAHHLSQCWDVIKQKSIEKNEWSRYIEIEFPIFNLMTAAVVRGIRINLDELRKIKNEIDKDFYKELKTFCLEFNLKFEVPSDADVLDFLNATGYDIGENSIDQILRLMPMENNFGEKLIKLRKLDWSRETLAMISVSKRRVCPIVEPHTSVTSRIYYKSPTLQNISKQYRKIFIADEDCELSYVDYDQFEVGIMAALSKDSELVNAYTQADIYSDFALVVFGDLDMRSLSKKLFLSFTYGMTTSKILDIVRLQQGDKSKARDFFKKFHVFETWRETVAKEFEIKGRIGTALGNFLERSGTGPLNPKERRSCVSQVVQGTGSLIFKSALLKLREESAVDILIPMHDAILVQHPLNFEKAKLVKIFEDTMTSVLNGAILGKASIQNF